MEVHINNCLIDFTLEEEKTVFDVIKSIRGWANERSLILTEAYINGNVYNIDKIPEISIDDADIIDCKVQSRADIIISSLNEGIDYCLKVYNFINRSISENNIEKSEIEHLETGIDWIIDVIYKVLQLLTYSIEEVKNKDKTIKDYIDRLNNFRTSIEEKDNSSLIQYFNTEKDVFADIIDIFRMLLLSENMKSVVIQSIDSPEVLISSIYNIKNEIPEQLIVLEETAVAFQTGKDNEASSKLQLFIDFIFRYNRTCYQLAPVFGIDLGSVMVDKKNLNEKNIEIHDLLSDVISAMENNDMISLSDILEYELKPSLENLGEYIDFLINAATNREIVK